MKIVIIGATGHIGTYLVPRLINAGHEVIAVSRGSRQPYTAAPGWERVRHVQLDRDTLESEGTFGDAIAALGGDVVVDLICFTLDSASQLVDAIGGQTGHLIHIGTIWTHGYSVAVPTREDAAKAPFGDYGIQKAAIEAYLLDKARTDKLPVTILHPGHIVGPGWVPLNPAGNFNPDVFSTLAQGRPLALPNFGMETVHHVHADDIARLAIAAIEQPEAALGESFHAVSSQAITLRGFAEATAGWFGKTADLSFLPYPEWTKTLSAEDAAATWEHIARSPNCSMEKARTLLGFEPAYSSLDAVRQSVDWLVNEGTIVAS